MIPCPIMNFPRRKALINLLGGLELIQPPKGELNVPMSIIDSIRSTVLVADPQPLICASLSALIESGPYRVIAQCEDGEEAFRQIVAKRPSMALLELQLPKLHTLEIIRKIRLLEVPTRLIVLSTRGDRKTVIEALRSGVHGYLLKTAAGRFLLEGFDQVRSGGIYVSPQVELEKIFAASKGREISDPIETLSAREHQVFAMLVDGMRAKEIAGRLEVSPKTIDTYRASLMRKLDIHDVAGLVKYAISRNLISMPALMGA